MSRRPAPVTREDAFRLFNEINIVAQLSSNEMARRLPHDLTPSQFSVLNWFVRVDDVATPGRLARAFQVSKGAMTNTLGKLQQKGFITVTPDPGSGRRKLVRMTTTGRRARAAAIAGLGPVLDEFLPRIRPDDLRQLLRHLEAIRRYLDQRREREPETDHTP
ncbi:MAG: MarR family transcriptional regulator [Pseudomonadales bacterium]